MACTTSAAAGPQCMAGARGEGAPQLAEGTAKTPFFLAQVDHKHVSLHHPVVLRIANKVAADVLLSVPLAVGVNRKEHRAPRSSPLAS
jgi:hypothetical protein